MEPGHYVVRLSARSVRDRLAVETRPFALDPQVLAEFMPDAAPGELLLEARRRMRREAEIWALGLRATNARDDIFVFEVGAAADAPPITSSGLLKAGGRRTLSPGFYAVRIPARGTGTRLTVESVPFAIRDDVHGVEARERALVSATNWAEFMGEQHPGDAVFVIEREAEKP